MSQTSLQQQTEIFLPDGEPEEIEDTGNQGDDFSLTNSGFFINTIASRFIPISVNEKCLDVNEKSIGRGRPRTHHSEEELRQANVRRVTECRKRKKEQLPIASQDAGQEDQKHFRARGTGDNEWYTPAKYLEAARQVLEKIDLDPASSVEAQMKVQAEHFYTEKDNGLSRAWWGRIFLNPPYAQPFIEHFVTRLVDEYNLEHVSEAILLTHNYTDTKWFHIAESSASRICFTRGRIKFEDANGKTASPTQGQAFFYFGTHPERFKEAFSQFGMVR